jgi:RNA 3'-terminal phosphate cyclase
VSRVVACEPAGGGNMRVYCAAVRGNEIMPLYTTVMPIVEMIEGIAYVKRRATEIWNETQLVPDLVS